MCFTKGCASYRKSIPRAEMESAFMTLLSGMRPAPTLFTLVKSMFKQAWELQRMQVKTVAKSLNQKIAQTEQQVSQLLDRIVEASNARVIAAYEERIAKLEREKLVIAERLENSGQPLRSFEVMFELASEFLSSPCNLWDSGRLEDRQTVLKLAFDQRLTYRRKTGFRTPKTSMIFKTLEEIGPGKAVMAEGEGFEPSVLSPVQRFSRPPRSTTPAPLR